MGMLDHWHPMLLGRNLKSQPVGVRLAGRDLVLFRPASGGVAALDNQCPHRRMKLELGSVVGDRLRCKYHGWTYDAEGCGESPGTPKLNACATPFDVREEHGVVWVKARGVEAPFPQLSPTGYHLMCTLEHPVKAPLEVSIDNFTEIEHTPTAHALFGYPLERMHEVTVKFEATDTTVRVINSGPTKPVPTLFRWMLGISNDDLFIDDWTTYFSPLYSVYDHEWVNRTTGKKGRVGWKLYMFYTPRSETETLVTTFCYGRSTYPGPTGGLRLFNWLLRWLLSKEIDLDVAILEGLASHDPSLAGMKLSRFDRALGLNRERIQSLYRGEPAKRLSLAG